MPFPDVRLQAAGLEAAIEPGQGRGQDNTDQLASDTSGDQLPEILAQDGEACSLILLSLGRSRRSCSAQPCLAVLS